jgi:predicted DNA-binding protein (MmcQ/YjbR family)
MNMDELRAYLLGKRGTWEDAPFGPDSLVYKVKSKMFALIPLDTPTVEVVLKCDPHWAILLRDSYPAVTSAWHFNKRHWNAVRIDGSIPLDEILEMIDHSYDLVVKNLSRRERDELAMRQSGDAPL